MVTSWADQLLLQLLMEQFDTLPLQYRHIEYMHEGHVGNLKSLFKSIHNYANMVFLHQQMKEELKVQAVLQILSKFDLDL